MKNDQSNQQSQDVKNSQPTEEKFGSSLSPEEKELRKLDDYKGHSHEKDRNPKAEYREGELHGVVGKEIHDILKKDKALHEVDLQEEYKFHKQHDKLYHKNEPQTHEREKHHGKEHEEHHNVEKTSEHSHHHSGEQEKPKK
jgi:hypothetical protein